MGELSLGEWQFAPTDGNMLGSCGIGCYGCFVIFLSYFFPSKNNYL